MSIQIRAQKKMGNIALKKIIQGENLDQIRVLHTLNFITRNEKRLKKSYTTAEAVRHGQVDQNLKDFVYLDI